MPEPTPTEDSSPWQFKFYISPSGYSEAFEYLDDLRVSDWDSYGFFIKNIHDPILKNGPFKLDGRYWENLGNGFSEIRIGHHHRIYCCTESPRCVFALAAVYKLFRAFESKRGKYVRLCEQRRADIRSGNYDEKTRNAAFQRHRARRRR